MDNNVLKRYICNFEKEEKGKIIKEKHLPGHIGVNKLKNALDEEYCGITSVDVSNFIKSCDDCIRKSKPETIKSVQPIVIDDIHQRIMADLIDFSMYEHLNSGYKYAFTLIDCFSKFAFVFPIKKRDGSTIKDILEELFYTEGSWSFLHTDNGREFCNSDFESVCKKFEVGIIHGRPRHPQSQGQIERFNRTFKERLRMSLGNGNVEWIKIYKDVLFQYNNTIHRATKHKPFNLFRGINIIERRVEPVFSNNNSIQNEARDNLKVYASKYSNIDEEILNKEYKLNDKVLLLKDFDKIKKQGKIH
ncbi:Pol polyprotein [Dictyocoela muelleri]|nr:Pol polyprotein [Dictyocoela muelleri]